MKAWEQVKYEEEMRERGDRKQLRKEVGKEGEMERGGKIGEERRKSKSKGEWN